MPTQDPFASSIDPVTGRIVLEPENHLQFRVASGHVRWVWRGIGVPLFWVALFDRDDASDGLIVTSHARACERLRARSPRWKAKMSGEIARGFDPFVAWVTTREAHDLALSVSTQEPWRRNGIVSAMRDAIAFLDDDERDEPGPILSGWSECLTWKRTKKGMQLAIHRAVGRWPDDGRLFDDAGRWLPSALVGVPPFREGPWPERRFVEDASQPIPDEARAREAEYRRVLGLAPVLGGRIDALGNLEAIERERARCRELLPAAEKIAAQTSAFAARHQVRDDGSWWRQLIADARQHMAALDELELRVRAAMRDAGVE